MSRIYAVPTTGALSAAADLLEILPAVDKPCRLAGYLLAQTSEVGDAQEENVRVSVIRLPATVTGGSGGASVTPVPLDGNDAAAGFAAEVRNTTVATTSGSAATLEEHAWNVRSSPYERWIPEDQRPRVQNGEALVVRIPAPADEITFAMTFFVEEL